MNDKPTRKPRTLTTEGLDRSIAERIGTRKAAPSDWATADVDRRLAAIKATGHGGARFHERVDPTPTRRRVHWDRILTLAALALLAGSAAWAAIYQVTLAVASSSICTP